MKGKRKKIHLLQKTSRSFLLVSATLMVLSAVCLYFIVSALLRQEIEEELYSTEDRVAHFLANNSILPFLPPVIEVRKINVLQPEIVKDTLIYDPWQDEMELFHELSTFKRIGGAQYQITIRALVVESRDILVAVVISYIIILILAFLFQFYLNKKGNEQLWNPFFRNLGQMKQFSLSSETPIQLTESEIVEFTELNKEISALTGKVRQDYKNLKQFTENISHEIQTPLAIIQAKIENMMNGDNLNNLQFEHLASIQKDIHRLAQLNKKLTLLTKIDNKQFQKVAEVNISELLRETVANFLELSNSNIHFSIENEILVKMDVHLANVLCSNLVSNAIKYHTPGSEIKITISGHRLRLSNHGEEMLKQPEKVFGRFYRENTGLKSTGLGLSIVKKICELYGFHLTYDFVAHRHIFSVEFDMPSPHQIAAITSSRPV